MQVELTRAVMHHYSPNAVHNVLKYKYLQFRSPNDSVPRWTGVLSTDVLPTDSDCVGIWLRS